jgi:hypothetical protein
LPGGAKRSAASPAASPSICLLQGTSTAALASTAPSTRCSHRRAARPHHATCKGSIPPGRLCRQRQGDHIFGASAGPSSWPTSWEMDALPALACLGEPCCRAIRSAASRPASGARQFVRARRWAISWRRSCICRPRPSRAWRGRRNVMHVRDQQRFSDSKYTSSEQRPSMSQDLQKGRRTEIEPLNGFVMDDPKHITELRLNRAAPLQSLPPLPGRRRVYLRAQAGLPRQQDDACLRPKSRSLQSI